MRCCMTEGGPCFTGALSGVYEPGAVTLSPLKAGLTAVSYNVIKNSCLIIFAIASFPRRRGPNLARNGCPIKTLGHDG
jgi:hypothetical protein